jgi:hypothetical protein
VLVAPLNLPVAVAPDFEDALPLVEHTLLQELQARGARVGVIYPADAQQLWQAAVSGTKHTGDDARDLRASARTFSDALTATEEFDLLILPSLVLREARVSGRTASWDGVKRRIEVRSRANGDAPLAAPDAPVFDGAGVVAAPAWGGKISGLSLHLMGFRPGQRRPTERWGGLDLAYDPVQVRDTGSDRPATELRPTADLLASPDAVREGIAVALDPLWRKVR